MNKLIWICVILAIYGGVRLYNDIRTNKELQEWLGPVANWIKPKTDSAELTLATDIAFYTTCVEGTNPQIGDSDQFVIKDKKGNNKIVKSSEFISSKLADKSNGIWNTCNLDSVEYSLPHMDECISKLIKEKCNGKDK